jgi:predicted TIM-barrel fold metal-dependent hydrolase
MKGCGIDGGLLISPPPACFTGPDAAQDADVRLAALRAWTDGQPNLFPVFWIDPLEDDAAEQVDRAVEAGAVGFKVICGRYIPGDHLAMDFYRHIARSGRPILFHSGILWDGAPSGMYNRPAGFEALLDVDGLRFCLAHVSWPWCDECIAVYGKFQTARKRRGELDVEMFIDLTPGTPAIYRRDVLTKLFTVGYDVENNIIFGTDGKASDYNAQWARDWIERDNAIYTDIGVSDAARERIYAGNLLRFLGVSGNRPADG